LLEHGLDANTPVGKDIRPLTYAAYCHPASTVSLLLSHNATIAGSRALSATATSHFLDWETKLSLLLQASADINALDLELPWMTDPVFRYPTATGTSMHWAAKWGFENRVKWLAKRGADVEVRNSNGLTAGEVGEKARKSGRLYRGWSRKFFLTEAKEKAESNRKEKAEVV
jgi:hypothetical protein